MKHSSGNERRKNNYRFHTLLEMLDHYGQSLSAQQMEAVIRDTAKVFQERDWASEQDSRLQYIKKCECIMEALVTMKGTLADEALKG